MRRRINQEGMGCCGQSGTARLGFARNASNLLTNQEATATALRYYPESMKTLPEKP